jgi:hypothetical protein
MPDLKGDFDVDFRATLEQENKDGKWETIEIQPSFAKVKVPNINSALTNQIEIEIRRLADNSTGKLVASGSVRLFDKFRVDTERFGADESIEIQNVPLASALPFLDAKQIDKLAGTTSSKLQVKCPASMM